MTKFSDPAWWPTAPARPPKAAPVPVLVLGTLLPLVLAGVVAAYVIKDHGHGRSSPTAAGRSIAAFEACMGDEGADTPSVSTNSRLLRLAAVACKGHLPPRMSLPDFTPASGPPLTPREAFQQCMQSALAGFRGNGGRFSSVSRKTFEDASSLCRSLARTGTGRVTA